MSAPNQNITIDGLFYAGQNNNGDGKLTIPVGTGYGDLTNFNYRSVHTVNGGHITENAHAFSLGGTVHF